MRRSLHPFLAGIGFALGLLSAPQGVCQSYEFPLDTVLNGSEPTSARPWATATVTTLFPGRVSLTIQCNLTTTSEFVAEVGLNLRPGLSPADLIFSQTSGPGYSSLSQPAAQNLERLTGAGSLGRGLDILLDWGGTGDRLDGLDLVQFMVTGPPGLSADDFLFYNTLNDGQGPILIGAHLQGIPLSGGGTTSSAIIQTIPEPGMAALLFIGLGVWRLCGRGRPGGRD